MASLTDAASTYLKLTEPFNVANTFANLTKAADISTKIGDQFKAGSAYAGLTDTANITLKLTEQFKAANTFANLTRAASISQGFNDQFEIASTFASINIDQDIFGGLDLLSQSHTWARSVADASDVAEALIPRVPAVNQMDLLTELSSAHGRLEDAIGSQAVGQLVSRDHADLPQLDPSTAPAHETAALALALGSACVIVIASANEDVGRTIGLVLDFFVETGIVLGQLVLDANAELAERTPDSGPLTWAIAFASLIRYARSGDNSH